MNTLEDCYQALAQVFATGISTDANGNERKVKITPTSASCFANCRNQHDRDGKLSLDMSGWFSDHMRTMVDPSFKHVGIVDFGQAVQQGIGITADELAQLIECLNLATEMLKKIKIA